MRRELGRRLVEVEGETERVREEVTAQFEHASRKKDHDHQMKVGVADKGRGLGVHVLCCVVWMAEMTACPWQVEELTSALLQRQCQVRQVTREIEAARKTQETCKEEAV